MRTIMLDGSLYASRKDLHLALQRLLALPDYYGMNADALSDCISEMRETVNLWIADPGRDDVTDAIRVICAVIEDNGGYVKEL